MSGIRGSIAVRGKAGYCPDATVAVRSPIPMNPSGQSSAYRHPGQLFLAHHGALEREADALRYVEFLRQEAGLSDEPPIDLACIYQHFGMPTPLRAPLVDQQGILVNSDAGLILIKEDDPIARQRFTEGHELMELLFDACDRLSPAPWDAERKEKLCDQGAAELLMPQSSFQPRLHELGLSLQTGRTLAKLYQTSLQATLIRMIEHSSEAAALILWHRAFSRSESQQKLRVWWRTCTQSWQGGFIPKNKSIPAHSLISIAYTHGQPQMGMETIDLGGGAFPCRIEAVPMQIGNKPCVLSLLHVLAEENTA